MSGSNEEHSGDVESVEGKPATVAQKRLNRLNAHITDLAATTASTGARPLDRGTVSAVLRGGGSRTSKGRVDAALDEMEAAAGLPPWTDEPAPVEVPRETDRPSSVIRFTVEGVYGAKALIVEAPPQNLAELEAAVDRIMRRLQQGQQGTAHPGEGE